METANAGLDSSVARAPARQSGGRRFQSHSRQYFLVHPNKSNMSFFLKRFCPHYPLYYYVESIQKTICANLVIFIQFTNS